MARNMITKYGMSESIGPVYYPNDELAKLSVSPIKACSHERFLAVDIRRSSRSSPLAAWLPSPHLSTVQFR